MIKIESINVTCEDDSPEEDDRCFYLVGLPAMKSQIYCILK